MADTSGTSRSLPSSSPNALSADSALRIHAGPTTDLGNASPYSEQTTLQTADAQSRSSLLSINSHSLLHSVSESVIMHAGGDTLSISDAGLSSSHASNLSLANSLNPLDDDRSSGIFFFNLYCRMLEFFYQQLTFFIWFSRSTSLLGHYANGNACSPRS